MQTAAAVHYHRPVLHWPGSKAPTRDSESSDQRSWQTEVEPPRENRPACTDGTTRPVKKICLLVHIQCKCGIRSGSVCSPCHLHTGINIMCSTNAGDLGSWLRSLFKAVFDQLYHQVFGLSFVLFSWYFPPILI